MFQPMYHVSKVSRITPTPWCGHRRTHQHTHITQPDNGHTSGLLQCVTPYSLVKAVKKFSLGKQKVASTAFL